MEGSPLVGVHALRMLAVPAKRGSPPRITLHRPRSRRAPRNAEKAKTAAKIAACKALVQAVSAGTSLSRLKVKVPSGLHVGNTAARQARQARPVATHSCCGGNGGNTDLVACPAPPGPACPAPASARGAAAAGGPSRPGPSCHGPGHGPGRRLVKGLGPGLGPKGSGLGPGGWLLSRANCPCSDSAKCHDSSCFMFMFRNRRNTLAKRLWNARVLQRGDHAASRGVCSPEPAPQQASQQAQQAVLRNTFLKRLKEPQLETLLQAVESRGASLTSCVVLDAPGAPSGPSGEPGAEPHLLCCQIWRWPELQQGSELRPLPMCSAGSSATTVCCNPYHWSRLCKPESPPPPYGRLPEKRLKPDCAPSEDGHDVAPPPPPPPCEDPLSRDQPDPDEPRKDAPWGRMPPRWQDWQSWQGSFTTNGEGASELGLPPERRPWCQLAYWELADRVGRLYEVRGPYINVSAAAEPSNQGLCLATLANHAPPRPAGTAPALAVERTRTKIGLGVTLSQEDDGVWAYNRSDHPIFVNSPTLDDPDSRTLLVYRVPPGHCLNVFRADTTTQHWERWRRVNEATNSGPVDPRAVRISFAKGWGPKYSRQEVTACPCWIEVLLSPCR